MEGQLSIADREVWAAGQFATAELGDVRRTRRLVKLGAQMAGNSSGSIPQQTERSADMKAAYRLFAQEAVTHEAICRPHFARTRALAGAAGTVIFAQDTAELNFTGHRQTEGLAPIGGGGRCCGLHQQNILAVDPHTRRPLGLMYQRHHRRQEAPPRETRAQLRKRPPAERESHWWIEGIRAVGPPPEGCCWIHVLDRGGDTFGVHHEIRQLQADYIIRAGRDRRIKPPDGCEHLFAYARSRPALGSHPVTVRTPSGALRQAQVRVSAGKVTFLPPKMEPELRHLAPIACQVVRVWEEPPAEDGAGLEWILLTSRPASTYAAAQVVTQGYACRWLIEEFHKCEKTGCKVEDRQLTNTDRLEPLIGLLSVLAVHLLELKYVARDWPNTPARELFDEQAVQVMSCYLKRPGEDLTVAQFWRGIGRLGGHLGRKCDGPLGWLRAWRGWQAFQLILLGAQLTTTEATA